MHEPAVDCISNGKARERYEFGTKVSVATTMGEGFVVGMRSLPGNPHDGHTLADALEQLKKPHRHAPCSGFRRPWLHRSWCIIEPGVHQRPEARRHAIASQAHSPAQRHRTYHRPHEHQRPPQTLPTQRRDRRRPLRRTLWLRSEYPPDPRTSEESLARNLGPNPCCTAGDPVHSADSSHLHSDLITIFRADSICSATGSVRRWDNAKRGRRT